MLTIGLERSLGAAQIGNTLLVPISLSTAHLTPQMPAAGGAEVVTSRLGEPEGGEGEKDPGFLTLPQETSSPKQEWRC